MDRLKIVNVVGARPNFMKMAPLMAEYAKHPSLFAPLLVHTGQHFDDGMSDIFFRQLGMRKADAHLGVNSGNHAQQTARVMMEMDGFLQSNPTDLVVVVGDVNSTMAATLVAAKRNIPVAHVEAGLRSFDRAMPEEVNRVVTDALSDYCFTHSEEANVNLRREGVAADKIFFAGNVMIDSLLRLKEESRHSTIRKTLGVEGAYALLTLHRPSNVDTQSTLAGILGAVRQIQQDIAVVFPVHPRTKKRMQEFGLWEEAEGMRNLKLADPIGYLDMLHLTAHAKVVLSDSGGVQEETTLLGVPCLTLRENTERSVTVTEGTNILVGSDPKRILDEFRNITGSGGKRGRIPEKWDGKAAERIIRVLIENPPRRVR